MATKRETSATGARREAVPFTVRTADGDDRRADVLVAASRRRRTTSCAVLESLPWFEPGKPLRNYMLHETDFYDEVEQIWGRRWGAEGIGTLREVLVSRPTENEIRPEYARGVAVLLLERRGERRPRPAAGAVRRVLRGARRQRRPRQLHRAAGAGDRRVRLDQEPRHARRRRPRRPRRRDPAPLRARLVAARTRGDLGADARRAPGARST